MILEVATIHVQPECQDAFEAAFDQAGKIIVQADGHRAHELQRSIETPGRYVLLVEWESVEHHTIGFRQSSLFQQWRALLGPYFLQPPVVEHCCMVSESTKRRRVRSGHRIYQD